MGQALAEEKLLESLRAGNEEAFRELVREYQPSLVRVARIYVSNQAAAEDVAAETWLGVLKGLDRFEGRSSLRTWIFRIATNIAKTRGVREARSVPLSSFGSGVTGKGSITAARLAIEGFHGKVNDRKIELFSADTQNKPDIAGNLAREFIQDLCRLGLRT